MRAVSLHRDVIVVTSRLLQVNCTIVRASAAERGAAGPQADHEAQETFVIDSPVLPDELEALPSLLAQAGFPAPSGLLATHADWDHVLAPLAFPGVALGCAESSARRLAAEPGAAQRELRAFDEGLYVRRPRPLALVAPQPLPVPGRCEIGARGLHLHPAEGHTGDGMAVWIPWARTLVAGDYLSVLEIPTLGEGGDADAYARTLASLRPLLAEAEHVVPGHGPVIGGDRAQAVLAEDLRYLAELAACGEHAALPEGRRTREQRRLHACNAQRIGEARAKAARP